PHRGGLRPFPTRRSSDLKWRRPSRGRVTSRYGPRSLLGGSFHAGVDYAGGPYTYAAAAGKVYRTGWNILAGRTGIGIGIDHGGRSEEHTSELQSRFESVC